ncbi:trigger factor [Desulfuribacillus alkaliarsenatis]|uniref:Trigger factor n=1 Tax=Desulfuribacillus alkaliarsenatis TaxID=766136 RepID=A0A1E5G157_9FIRM|nr:trigger factor [Desulfuribacillus alkaliarsenatis]OEF96564.1 trigger factor [Desulfuribacillus alkaliarsenatis]
MGVKLEKIGPNRVKLEIEASAELVNKGLDFALTKGIGEDALLNEALNHIIPEVYEAAVQETGITPISKADIFIIEAAKDQPLRFSAEVFIKPEIKLGKYKGLETTKDKALTVTDAEIEKELLRYRQGNAKTEVVEDGEVLTGDIVKIDFEGFKDGVAFAGGSSENYSLEIGSGSFIPGFEEQVIGMKLNEEKDIEVVFPENYHAEDLAGAPVTFKVRVNEITRKQIAELDDEFAKTISDFNTIAELKEDVRKVLLARKEATANKYKREQLVKQAVNNATFELDEQMIDAEVKRMVRDFENQAKAHGTTLEGYLEQTNQTLESFETQFRDEAQNRLESHLVLQEIASVENIEVTEDEINNEVLVIAKTYNKQPEEIQALLENKDNANSLKSELAMRKAEALLVEHSESK